MDRNEKIFRPAGGLPKGERFPEGFFWGAATSAHQVEGNNHNDWTEWEYANSARLAVEAAKRNANARMRIPDYILNNYPNPLQPENYISGKACDHYNRFREDFDIAKFLGHNAHRFSIEWSRIEPEEGKFNQEEIEHYRQVILALRERGLEPFVTLWHFTNPIWIRDIGGWENKKTIKYFIRYVEKIINDIGEQIKFWIPINELSVYAGMGYAIGHFPPQVRSLFRANAVLNNLIEAHKEAYKLLHGRFGQKAMVGSTHNYHYDVPHNKFNPLDILATKILHYIRDTRSSKWAKGYEDFIGLNYYFRDTVKFVLSGGRYANFFDIRNPNKEVSDMGWDICPAGIYYVLKSLKKWNKPVYITENGLADVDDSRREKFIKDHLYWVHKAIQEGVDVKGYFYWSLLDNFEWDKGFWPRFGLVGVDYSAKGARLPMTGTVGQGSASGGKTQERKIRPSAYEYAKICKENSLII